MPTRVRIGKVWAAQTLLLLLAAPRPAAAQVSLYVPGVGAIVGWTQDKDNDVTDRWWFWVIIGLLAALTVVLVVFGVRGVMRWRAHKRKLVEGEGGGVAVQVEGQGDGHVGVGATRVQVEAVAAEVELMEAGAVRQGSKRAWEVDWEELDRRTAGAGGRRGWSGERAGAGGVVGQPADQIHAR